MLDSWKEQVPAALLQYLDEQSLTRRRMAVAELFAANVDPALGAYLEATGENPYAPRGKDSFS